jgi:hypothetical protein
MGRARLDDFPVLHHHDDVAAPNRAQSMRDEHRGASARHLLQALQDINLRRGVQRGRRLVREKKPRLPQKRARDGDALLFPAAELDASLAHHRV